MFKTGIELAKGISNLPMAVVALFCVFIISIYDKSHKDNVLDNELRHRWGWFFTYISIIALLGTAVHSLELNHFNYELIWSFLYIFMFQICRVFNVMALEIFTDGALPTKRGEIMLNFVTVFLFVAAGCVELLTASRGIYIFYLYAIILMTPVIVTVIKRRRDGAFKRFEGTCLANIYIAVIMLVGAVVLATCFDKIVIAHIFVALALIPLCLGARLSYLIGYPD